MLGNMFGIQLTLGHLIVGLAMVLAYDLILNILPNPWSEWWTSRDQFPLRVLVFGVVMGLAALVQTNNLGFVSALAVAYVIMLIGWSWWQANNQRQQSAREPARQTQTRPAEPPAPTPTPRGQPAPKTQVKKEKRK